MVKIRTLARLNRKLSGVDAIGINVADSQYEPITQIAYPSHL